MTNKPERYGVAAGAIRLIATGTVAAALGVTSAPQAQAGEAEAMVILKSMADYLVSQETLAFTFDIPDAAFTFEPPEDATQLAADALIDLDELPPPAEQGDLP